MAGAAAKTRGDRRVGPGRRPTGVPFLETRTGKWFVTDRSGRKLEVKAPPGPHPGDDFSAREALRRSGLGARDDLQATGALARDAAGRASSWWGSDPTLRPYHPSSFAELLVFAGASLLGLALLDTALRGRGPAGVERVLGGLGGGIRRLFDPRDPLVRSASAPAFTPPGLGGDSSSTARGTDAGARFATANGVYPLAKRGAIIGRPYTGTHTLGNWESDNAVDIAAPVGTPVYAVTSGRIGSQIGALNSSNPRMAGLRVHLLGASGTEFYYAHLSRLVVHAGERVREGQLLGYSGSANGVAHLHFATSKGSPFSWVAAQIKKLARAVGAGGT